MDKKNLRIVFMGTPEFAVGTLKRLVEEDYNVVAVVTQPDKPVGRHQDSLKASEVKEYALSKGLPVLQPVKMKDPAFIEELASYEADLQVVVAFRMLPEVVWAMPKYGTFNVHAALLPKYRGAAPINWAVINGEEETGVTTFFLDKDIDTGRVIQQMKFLIPDDADVEYVYDGLMNLGADIAIDTVNKVLEGNGVVESVHQEEMISQSTELKEDELPLAPKIFKETCEINFDKEAKKVYDFIRGLSPYPGAWTTLAMADANGETPENGKKDNGGVVGKILKIFRTVKTNEAVGDAKSGTLLLKDKKLYVACSDCWLQLEEIQLTGKKRMSVKDFLNGNRDIDSYCCKHN